MRPLQHSFGFMCNETLQKTKMLSRPLDSLERSSRVHVLDSVLIWDLKAWVRTVGETYKGTLVFK